MNIASLQPLKIAIVGAGFSGTALAALLHRLSPYPLEIFLFEKTGQFAMGDAYRTPYAFHLLNVKSGDMSAFADDPDHFNRWLAERECEVYSENYVPRYIYRDYLLDLLNTMKTSVSQKITLTCISAEVIDAEYEGNRVKLHLQHHAPMLVDKAVFALGNNPPVAFPFPVSEEVTAISNPWDYEAPSRINQHDPVLIVGTGLSMVDTVLTLHHKQHQGPIYAISRHGLLPLPHTTNKTAFVLTKAQLKKPLRTLMPALRALTRIHEAEGGEWQAIMIALRPFIADIWIALNLQDRQQFLRHVLPYWNIHRHRVHKEIADVLLELQKTQRLKVIAGRIIAVEKGEAHIRLRGKQALSMLPVKTLINCLGPALQLNDKERPLIHALLKRNIASLDALQLGFQVDEVGALKNANGEVSKHCYTIGLLRRGEVWESTAVPNLRQQNLMLATHLLDYNKDRYERERKNTG